MPRLKRFNFDGLAQRALDAWLRDKPTMMATDCETTGLTWEDKPFGVTIAWENEQHYIELDDFVREATIASMLERTPYLILHNSKFDFEMLIKAGLLERKALTFDRFHDTECLAQLLDENRLKGLKPLARSVLGKETDEQEALKVVRRKLKLTKDDGFHLLPREVLIPYAVMDARFTFDLYQVFWPEVQKSTAYLAPLYDQERKLTLALLDMEMAGMGVDEAYVEKQIKEFGTRIMKAQLEIAEIVGRDDFNPSSPKQILTAFRERGIELDATGEDVLRDVKDPLANAILELRGLAKLRNTYLVPMLSESQGGILHPSLRQHGTRTGRMSSGAATNN